MSEEIHLQEYIRSRHDFPKPSMVFRDITPLLVNAVAFRTAIKRMADHFRGKPVDAVAAESRGFVFAAPLAIELGVGFLPVHRPTAMPFTTGAFEYRLHEYHADVLEGYKAPDRSATAHILFVDDLLATGISTEGCCRLIEQAGGHVAGCAFLIELRDSTAGPASPNTTS